MKNTFFEGGVNVDKVFKDKFKINPYFLLPVHLVKALEDSIKRSLIKNNNNGRNKNI